MQAVGIIAEYNPFHNGHRWHLEKARELAGTPLSVAVMSGNFTQRGEPAAFDKWLRAETAVRAGVDLVLELPAVFAVRSAQNFAAGGIRLLAALGVVSHVCFGAEHDHIADLTAMAAAVDNQATIARLRDNMKTGQAYAAALTEAMQATTGLSGEWLRSPNNILAIEYLRAITKFAPALLPLCLKRQQAGYHDSRLTAPFASAAAIRQALMTTTALTADIKKTIPPSTTATISEAMRSGLGPIQPNAWETIILTKLRMATANDLQDIPEISEGLHNKLQEGAMTAATVPELLEQLKSRRYPMTRLQRIAIHILLDTSAGQIARFDQTGPQYARVLAFNRQGCTLLRQMKQIATIPVITKTTHYLSSRRRTMPPLSDLQQMLAIDTVASDIYTLGLPNPRWRTGGWDFTRPPRYIACQPTDGEDRP